MTTSINEPHTKPNCANFSSGPCAKYPNWDISDLNWGVHIVLILVKSD